MRSVLNPTYLPVFFLQTHSEYIVITQLCLFCFCIFVSGNIAASTSRLFLHDAAHADIPLREDRIKFLFDTFFVPEASTEVANICTLGDVPAGHFRCVQWFDVEFPEQIEFEPWLDYDKINTCWSKRAFPFVFGILFFGVIAWSQFIYSIAALAVYTLLVALMFALLASRMDRHILKMLFFTMCSFEVLWFFHSNECHGPRVTVFRGFYTCCLTVFVLIWNGGGQLWSSGFGICL